jgi:hypothetical protein
MNLFEVFVVNLLNLLPDVLAVKITEYIPPGEKKEFSVVDRRIYKVFLDSVRSLRLFSPPPTWTLNFVKQVHVPEDILVRAFSRYPKLREMTFGPSKNSCGGDEFGISEAPYLRRLIAFLEESQGKRLLSSVKKIRYREIKQQSFEEHSLKEAKEINRLFLSSIGHIGLERVSIQAYDRGTLTGTEIQPLLNKSPHLKTFVFNGLKSDQIVSLSFANQTQLSKVKLLHWKGPSSTLESLRSCQGLEELVIVFYYRAMGYFLLEEHPWKLKRLELIGMTVTNDAVLDALTKRLPYLEYLHLEFSVDHAISDEGMELLGRNCPRLKFLKFDNENLSNSGLDRLTQQLPHLEVLTLDQATNVTEEGIAAIARNCRYLRSLTVSDHQKIEKSGIDALRECRDLRALEFSDGDPISLEGLHQLVEQRPQLQYVNIEFSGNEEEQITEFYRTFPRIKKLPYVSSLKKISKLINGNGPP